MTTRREAFRIACGSLAATALALFPHKVLPSMAREQPDKVLWPKCRVLCGEAYRVRELLTGNAFLRRFEVVAPDGTAGPTDVLRANELPAIGSTRRVKGGHQRLVWHAASQLPGSRRWIVECLYVKALRVSQSERD